MEVVTAANSTKSSQLLGWSQCGQEGTFHPGGAAPGAGDQDPHPGGTGPVFHPRWAQLLHGEACAVVTRVRHVVPSLLVVSPGELLAGQALSCFFGVPAALS